MNTISTASTYDGFAADAAVEERAAFIRRTYLHLMGAVLAFIGVETVIFQTPVLLQTILGTIGAHWWAAILAFLLAGWVARYWAHHSTSVGMQYLGLGVYTLLEAIIFIPLLMMAQSVGGDVPIIGVAGLLTMIIFTGLTAIVFVTKADFSFLRMALCLATLGVFGVALASAFMGFSIPLLLTAGCIILAGGWILYDTSNVLHHYRTDQHVGAALELFASIAFLFWELVVLLMRLQGDD
jgi:uncharacterized protein